MNGGAEQQLLEKRLKELSDRSFVRGIYTETDFLSPAAQAVAERLQRSADVRSLSFFGLFPEAERNLAVFGKEEELGCPYAPPIDCLQITPRSDKFGEELRHRDVLGAMLSLGIKREKIGDILLDGKIAYAAVLRGITPFLLENLTRIRHTDIRLCVMDTLPEAAKKEPEAKVYFVSSERLDCLCAAVYKLSRGEAKELFEKERVFRNSLPALDPAAVPKHGELISVRGFGRFRYLGIKKETKKHRLLVQAAVWE